MQKSLFNTITIILSLILTPIAISQEASRPIHTSQVLDDTPYRTKYVAPYTSNIKDEIDVNKLQCPIPMECRVANHTGIQCVFSSIEMLGRWAEEPKLISPPLTSRADCKGYSGPQDAAQKLTRLGVQFEQVYGNKQASLELVNKAMSNARGCLIGIPGHAMVLIHYDTKNDLACWVDNSDRSLKIHSSTIASFDKMWTGWVMVIYADKDIIPYKLNIFSKLPIITESGNNFKSEPGYIPLP